MRRKKEFRPVEAVKASDYGTPELRRKGPIKYTTTVDLHTQAKRLTQRPIDFYHSRGIIDDHQYMAAERFIEDERMAGLDVSIRTSLNLERGKSSSTHLVDRQIDAKKRFDKIMWRVLTRREASVVTFVVLGDGYMSDLSVLNKPLSLEAIEVLTGALDTILAFYKKEGRPS